MQSLQGSKYAVPPEEEEEEEEGEGSRTPPTEESGDSRAWKRSRVDEGEKNKEEEEREEDDEGPKVKQERKRRDSCVFHQLARAACDKDECPAYQSLGPWTPQMKKRLKPLYFGLGLMPLMCFEGDREKPVPVQYFALRVESLVQGGGVSMASFIRFLRKKAKSDPAAAEILRQLEEKSPAATAPPPEEAPPPPPPSSPPRPQPVIPKPRPHTRREGPPVPSVRQVPPSTARSLDDDDEGAELIFRGRPVFEGIARANIVNDAKVSLENDLHLVDYAQGALKLLEQIVLKRKRGEGEEAKEPPWEEQSAWLAELGAMQDTVRRFKSAYMAHSDAARTAAETPGEDEANARDEPTE